MEAESGGDEGAPGWKRTLYIMWFAQLVAILGFMFVIPFMPFYIRELGVTDERLVPMWSGLLGSASGLAFALVAPFWGALADRYGRRPMVLRSMFAGAVVLTLMGYVVNVNQLLVLRIMQGLLTGTIGASVALVSAITPRRRLGFSLGLMQTAVLSGASVGPWIGGAVADRLGYRLPFLVAGGALVVSGLLVALFTRESFVRPTADNDRLSTLGMIRQAPGYGTMLGIFFLISLAGTIVAPVFPLIVEKLLHDPANKGAITGMIMGITGLVEAVAAVSVGRWSDRVGQKTILISCTFLSGLVCLPMAVAGSVGQLFGLRAALGLTGGGTAPTINALVGKLMPRNYYGRAFGLTSSVSGLGGSAGPMIGGAMAAWWGLQSPFLAMGAMLIIIAAVAAWSIKDLRRGLARRLAD
ncbi:MAG TPA: MFS transporter [Armatimonadota bacterium]